MAHRRRSGNRRIRNTRFWSRLRATWCASSPRSAFEALPVVGAPGYAPGSRRNSSRPGANTLPLRTNLGTCRSESPLRSRIPLRTCLSHASKAVDLPAADDVLSVRKPLEARVKREERIAPLLEVVPEAVARQPPGSRAPRRPVAARASAGARDKGSTAQSTDRVPERDRTPACESFGQPSRTSWSSASMYVGTLGVPCARKPGEANAAS